MDFRTCLKNEQKDNNLNIYKEKIDPHLETAKKIIEIEPKPVLFENINKMKVAANLFSSRESYSQHLNIPMENFLQTLSNKIISGDVLLNKKDEIYGEYEWDEVDLTKLPILYHYQGDGGPYITSAVWIINDPEYGRNLSYHRMMVMNKTQGVVRVVENRGMHQALTKSDGRVEVAICFGPSPAVLLAAACSPKADVDEMELAARLDKITLVKCKTVDLHVPEDCELVLEGYFTDQLIAEGPFVDITGTWDHIRQQPILEVTRIANRKDPIYHALVPGKAEHQMLMGMPKELDIYNEVNKYCTCLDVRMTPGGCSWLHAVVKIQKQKSSDGRNALEAAFRAHKSLKHCVVVDEDIDIHDMSQVEWAIATRFQADKDLMILPDQPSSSLDPSAKHIPGQKSQTSKMRIDATIKENGKEKKMFFRI